MEQFLYNASVFVAGDNYQIIFHTKSKGIAWVETGGKKYCDDNNGTMRSEEKVHKITVPMKVLDNAGEYRTCFRTLKKRVPYFPETGELCSKHYEFKSVIEKDTYKTYMLGDTHSMWREPAMAASYFGDELDFLILNGDIANKSDSVAAVRNMSRLSGIITKGEIPVVFARGNHDTRGVMGPVIDRYIPTCNGMMYYTFRLGSIWGMVLDCGEDKPDSHEAYNGIANYTQYRKKELEFITEVTRSGQYNSEDILYKIVICHIHLNTYENMFEKELYSKWIQMLNIIKPDVMLCAHEHQTFVKKDDVFLDGTKITYPVVIGSRPIGNKQIEETDAQPDFHGTAIEFSKSCCNILFTDKNKNIIEQHKL